MGEIDKAIATATTFPTPNGGCHPLWVLGHLTLVEGFVRPVFYGEENPLAKWAPLFGQETVPQADASAYPSFAEIREKYKELRKSNLALLQSLSEADLDRPTKAPPPGREKEFATFGQTFLVLALHQTMHRAHVTDALRAAAAPAKLTGGRVLGSNVGEEVALQAMRVAG
jgi:uncharacterized damage-inducible protein DinB